jgi:hypothetical protein
MENRKTFTADFWYGSSQNERYRSDLNQRVEDALQARFGDSYLGMDGGSFVGVDPDEPDQADNIPMVTTDDRSELEEAFNIITAIVNRPVEMTLMDDDPEE